MSETAKEDGIVLGEEEKISIDNGTEQNEKTNDDEKVVDESESTEVDPPESDSKIPEIAPENKNKVSLIHWGKKSRSYPVSFFGYDT